MATEKTMSTKTRKIAAISAGALVVGLGTVFTLATWNDSEWVWGGADGDPNVGTSSFNVQQNTDPALPAGAWTDAETNPGGELQFSAGSLALTPGDTIYAPVSLQTEDESIAGDLHLQGAVAAEGVTANDPDDLLWNAVELNVWVNDGDGVTAPACDATTETNDVDWTALVTDAALATGAGPEDTQALAASSGNAQNYCFAITLPADEASNDTLQGLQIAPAWEFEAESE